MKKSKPTESTSAALLVATERELLELQTAVRRFLRIGGERELDQLHKLVMPGGDIRLNRAAHAGLDEQGESEDAA